MTGELARLLDAFIMSPANHYEVADLPRPLRGAPLIRMLGGQFTFVVSWFLVLLMFVLLMFVLYLIV